MESTDGKVIGSDEGIKLGYIDDNLLGTKLGYIGGITLGNDVETDLGSFDGSFDGSNEGELKSYCLETQ